MLAIESWNSIGVVLRIAISFVVLGTIGISIIGIGCW